MRIPNKFTFTVYEPDLIFTATRDGEKYVIDWTDGIYQTTEYSLFNVAQYLTKRKFDDGSDWTIKEILESDTSIMDIRTALASSIPSIELQQAALSEINRLDEMVAKFNDFKVERFIDGEAYNIPLKLVAEFNEDIKWAYCNDTSMERWDLLDGKYNKYKV